MAIEDEAAMARRRDASQAPARSAGLAEPLVGMPGFEPGTSASRTLKSRISVNFHDP